MCREAPASPGLLSSVLGNPAEHPGSPLTVTNGREAMTAQSPATPDQSSSNLPSQEKQRVGTAAPNGDSAQHVKDDVVKQQINGHVRTDEQDGRVRNLTELLDETLSYR